MSANAIIYEITNRAQKIALDEKQRNKAYAFIFPTIKTCDAASCWKNECIGLVSHAAPLRLYQIFMYLIV